MTFEETITTSLLPRFHHLHGAKPEEEQARLKAHFLAHARQLSEFLHREFVEGTLSPATAIGLHKRLYPPGAKQAIGDVLQIISSCMFLRGVIGVGLVKRLSVVARYFICLGAFLPGVIGPVFCRVTLR